MLRCALPSSTANSTGFASRFTRNFTGAGEITSLPLKWTTKRWLAVPFISTYDKPVSRSTSVFVLPCESRPSTVIAAEEFGVSRIMLPSSSWISARPSSPVFSVEPCNSGMFGYACANCVSRAGKYLHAADHVAQPHRADLVIGARIHCHRQQQNQQKTKNGEIDPAEAETLGRWEAVLSAS